MPRRAPFSARLSGIPSCAGLMTRLALGRAQSAGVNLAPLLHHAGLNFRDIKDENVPLSVTAQITSLNLIAEALSDKLLGFHIARSMDLRKTGFLYYVAASAETLGDALSKIARYSVIVNEGVELKTGIDKALRINFRYPCVSRQSDRHQIEAWITALVRFSREMTDRELRLGSLRIMHQRIRESNEFDSFLGCNAEFGADEDELVLPREAAKLPIINADHYLNKLLTRYCEEVLANSKTRPGALRAKVENTIAALLPHGTARIDIVANKLGISPRTLRRKLALEDTSFARILEDLRIALAQRYLAEHDLPISRIAWLLGYTEVSAFSHAYRRWTGRAPRVGRSGRRNSSSSLTSPRQAPH
jgi:AraC-like DNA-binding protein